MARSSRSEASATTNGEENERLGGAPIDPIGAFAMFPNATHC
jgi:hypothetical protein